MGQTGANAIIILFAIGLVALVLLVRYVARLGANKASDAIQNAMTRSEMKKNPPKKENLADRYR